MSATHRDSASPPRRLLVVDDDPAVRSVIGSHFRDLGCEVTLASELEEAMALLELRPFDVLITDLGLTGLSRSEGLDVLSVARYHRPELRIVVLTGLDTPGMREVCLGRGADVFLPKPQPLGELARVALEGREEGA